ncbi:RNA-binding protein involved in heterochromatin assembly dri1 isoform X2 [Argentina anserina]|uniref:RNA-binding protein involved in heterochromatin assembly dri1 isoform X2 n=1 Tax=Argentina anserina TaxID=57926 RepID=UPI0021766748|nr:RNA-binding protein involved in heterochromatin assembly dri1 isoform X2 [Potentilla anserina]
MAPTHLALNKYYINIPTRTTRTTHRQSSILLQQAQFNQSYYIPNSFVFEVLTILRMSWAGGDWMCGACQHTNFKKREACQLCGYPKYGGPDPSTYACNRTEVLAGDWFCNCGAHNYAQRPNCFRCAAFRNDYGGGYNMMASGGCGSDGSAPPGWKAGDWICTRVGCGVHNYANRQECFKCKTPKDYGL